MAFPFTGNLFPNTDFNKINLDWILSCLKAMRGGNTGQYLKKKSNEDFDFEWDGGTSDYKDYVTPEMFGAKGDGLTDDTLAIQDAIDTGNPVYFAAKIYAVSSPLIMSDCKFFGDAGATIKATSALTGAVVQINLDAPAGGYVSKTSYMDSIKIDANGGAVGIQFNRTQQIKLHNLEIVNSLIPNLLQFSMIGSMS